MDDSTTFPIPLKHCSKCKEYKPYKMFGRNKAQKDGLHNYCKACASLSNQQTRQSYKAREVIDSPSEKLCRTCKLIKPIRDFSVARAERDGYADQCKQCRKAYYDENRIIILDQKRDYQAANVERLREYRRNFRLSNLERHRQRNREWYTKIRSDLSPSYVRKKEKQRLWSQANPDIKRAIIHRHRAHVKNIGGHFTVKDIAHIRYIQQGHCCYCGRLGQALTLEHIIPVTRKGSSNDPWNLCLTCRSCNSSKGNKLLEEWTDRWYLR